MVPVVCEISLYIIFCSWRRQSHRAKTPGGRWSDSNKGGSCIGPEPDPGTEITRRALVIVAWHVVYIEPVRRGVLFY